MEIKLIKFKVHSPKSLGIFTLNSSIFMILAVLLVLTGCSSRASGHLDDVDNSEYGMDNDRSSIFTDFGTTWLRLQIVNIYDYPQGRWNHTVTACNLGTNISCIGISHVFNHQYLPEIGIEIGSIVSVEVDAMSILPDPIPLFIHNWELVE